MKKTLLLAIAIFLFQFVSAQVKEVQSSNVVYNTAEVDVKPSFPGGYIEFYNYISRNYKTPKEQGLAGKIYVTFIVEIDGTLGGIKVLRDLGYGTGKEAIRVLKLSPKWIPGQQNGQKVRCAFSIPIEIKA